MTFLEIVGLISGFATIAGISVKSLMKSAHKTEILGYISDLETRDVLWAEIDDELKIKVIRSMDDILRKTRELKSNCHSDSELNKVLGYLIKVIKSELNKVHGYDENTPQGKYMMFMSLQKFRTEMARALSLMCAAFSIEPKRTELKSLITNMATVRPRT